MIDVVEEGNGNGRDDADSAPDRPPAPFERGSLSLDDLLTLLSDRYRRHSLAHLVERPDETGSIDEVTTHLLDRDGGSDVDRDDVEIALRHVHLPKLAEANLLEYDPRSGEIRYWSHERLERLLEAIEEFEDE